MESSKPKGFRLSVQIDHEQRDRLRRDAEYAAAEREREYRRKLGARKRAVREGR